ncbi:MAG: DUF2851 family protein [Polaribacter sp.]
MQEDFLHYVWKYALFSTNNLQTVLSERITIIHIGTHNKNAGPDFLNARIKIDHQLWVGNIEIHLKSSDWYLHHHEIDANYDAVILHVVWEHDADIFRENNNPISTLVLKGLVEDNLLKNYKNLFSSQLRWIPCQAQIHTIDPFTFSNWKERLFFERLENKSNVIHSLLENSNNDYEAVLFQLLAKNFGLKVNGEPFLQLAISIDFSIIRKERFDAQKLAALFFGQAGFLEEDIQNEYHNLLKKEYNYLKHKYQLKSMAVHQFSFFRMRPSNFPTIRIAQLVSLFYKHQNLFSLLIKTEQLTDFYNLFSIEIHDFWKTHYTFKTPSKKSAKKISKAFVDLLLINTIIPLKFQYLKERGKVDEENILKLIQQIKPEKNGIIAKFSELKITAKNALETQSLLELKNNYCTPKRCLECVIGNQLLKKQ